MGTPLRVLVVEDDEDDALLVLRALTRGGFDVTSLRVETPEEMSAALDQEWAIVISGDSMPRLGAPEALALLNERKLDLPFIIVSGTVGEQNAVAALRAGAHDFLTKGDLTRLIPAIERELREAAARAEQARTREQLIVSDRMASVGTLAAGVVHEINNPLAALMANLEFATLDVSKLLQRLRGGGDDQGARFPVESIAAQLDHVDEALQDARQCADRVRQIIRDLKLFSRVDEEKVGAVDVRRVLESALRMVWNEVRHRARLVKDYREVPPVQGNEGRLGQVFLNLVVNAAQAIPEGNADGNEIRIIVQQDPAGQVVVEVRDTGAGIPESLVTRIFDPFYTTKPIGVGTGLGLAICHRIVTTLGGTIVVESEVGRGTTMRVTLPTSRDVADDAPGPAAPVVQERRASILVVDDEPLIATAIHRTLSPEHDVATVSHARDALARVQKGERFDVVLCDLMMPDMTGMDLYAELVRIAPDQAERVAFMTGGAFTSRARDFLDSVRNARIEKPFERGGLWALVHSLLRGT
jgi:signal transduction histidine kinase